MADSRSNRSTLAALVVISLALVAWGVYLAVGAYFGGGNLRDDARRAWVVLAAVAIFVGVWWTLLLRRAKRTGSDRPSERANPK